MPLELDDTQEHAIGTPSYNMDENEQAQQIRRQEPPQPETHNYAEYVQLINPTLTTVVTSQLQLLLCVLTPIVESRELLSNQTLHTYCIQNGIHIRNFTPFTEMQICTDSHCTQVTESEKSFMFPANVCLHEDAVRVKVKRSSQIPS